jgi:hypothetical protein
LWISRLQMKRLLRLDHQDSEKRPEALKRA